MDQATIEAIAKATIAATQSGFDWKLVFAGIGTITALISSLGILFTTYFSYRKIKMDLSFTANKEWGHMVIESFAQLDGHDRGIIKKNLSFFQEGTQLASQPEKVRECISDYNKAMDELIPRHGELLTKFRMLFDHNIKEHSLILKNIDGYNEFFLKRLNGDASERVKECFDGYTNELCKALGQIVHKNIKQV